MKRRATIGTYVPADSAVHRADPRAKLVVSFCAIVALFALNSWVAMLVLLAATVGVTLYSTVPVSFVVRVLRPILIIAAFTLVVNTFAVVPAGEPVPAGMFALGRVGVTADGFVRGMFFVTRLGLVMLSTSLVTLTTSPVALTDGMASLMRPLRRFGVPVDDIATMMSIALRFIPTIADEVDRIVTAQTARGAQFDEGKLTDRMRAWIPVLIPLFVQMFRRADTLAMAMEARCYGSTTRTRLRELQLRTADVVLMVGSVGVLVLALVLRLA